LKKLFLVLIVLLAGCGGVVENRFPSEIMGQYPYYESLEELADRSGHIVRAIVLGEETVAGERMIYTVTAFEIQGVFKGGFEMGQQIEVRQAGGVAEEGRVLNRNRLEFAADHEVLLFLNEWGYLMNPYQSAYYLSSDLELSNVNDGDFLSGWETSLTLAEIEALFSFATNNRSTKMLRPVPALVENPALANLEWEVDSVFPLGTDWILAILKNDNEETVYFGVDFHLVFFDGDGWVTFDKTMSQPHESVFEFDLMLEESRVFSNKTRFKR
jgi:hypothetical protein